MKNILLLTFTIILLQACSTNESIFILDPTQSMLITGLGEGQDAAINPYSNEKSVAIVKNLGKSNFDVRIQNDGKIVKIVTLQPKERQEIAINKGFQLYLDNESTGKACVDFKRQ